MRTSQSNFGPLSFLGPSAYPWVFFLVFFFWDAGMSWLPLSGVERLGMFFFVFIPVFVLAVGRRAKPVSKPLWETEVFPRIPVWILGLLFLAALGIRLYKLTTISLWPILDEGSFGFYSSEISRQWRWNLFFHIDHVAPAPYWVMALFLKFFPPSLFSLWLFPALVSMMNLALGYVAGRRLFSKSVAFLWGLGWAFSFWPLYISHLSIAIIFVNLWECLGFLLLGYCLKTAPFPVRRTRWLLLGIVLGAGFYFNYILWSLIAFMIGLALWLTFRSIPSASRPWTLLGWIGVPAVLLPIPLVIQYFRIPPNTYLNGLWAFDGNFSWGHYGEVVGSYLKGVFWGIDPSMRELGYRPFWGGYLNPLLGAMFSMGAIEVVRRWRHPWILWMNTAILLFILPVFFAKNFEMFRIIPLLPLILFIVALGWMNLLSGLAPKVRFFFLAAIGLASWGMDFYHLTVAYPSFWLDQRGSWERFGKMDETYRAYGILKPLADEKGPGFLLTEFNASLEKDPRNKGLVFAGFPFDAARNKTLDPEAATWAAVFVNTDQLPFLRERFRKIEPVRLGKELDYVRPDQDYYLVLLPANAETRPILFRWVKANRFLEEMLYQSLCPTSKDFRQRICRQMLERYSLFQGEPLLESHYWSVIFNEAVGSGDNALEDLALKRLLRCGCASPKDLWIMGVQSSNSGNFAAAEAALRAAHRMDPSLRVTPATLDQIHRKALLQKNPGLPPRIGIPP